jgi:hypothetical protein
VVLAGVRTRIQLRARLRCEHEQRRTVCAHVVGSLCHGKDRAVGEWLRIAFDPRRDAAFQALDERGLKCRWNRADAARFEEDGSGWVLNPRWEADELS